MLGDTHASSGHVKLHYNVPVVGTLNTTTTGPLLYSHPPTTFTTTMLTERPSTLELCVHCVLYWEVSLLRVALFFIFSLAGFLVFWAARR